MNRLPFRIAVLLAGLCFCLPALTDDAIEGVQPAALDQPRVYMHLRRTDGGPVLKTGGEDGVIAIEAFLDTGASGMVLSTETADALGVKRATTASGAEVIFEDIGIGGAERFVVTEPLFAALAPYPRADEQDPAAYSAPVGPVRMQIRPKGGILQIIAPGMDVAGMPLVARKVIVLDPKPLADFDKIRTTVVWPGDATIPKTTRHVPLTYVSFVRFTRTIPKDAPPATHTVNPMIGPDPFKPNDPRKPVVIRHGGKIASGTFLLDTGAATSILSPQMASKLGIELAENGSLRNVPRDKQFKLPIGGLGGMKNASGLYFDRLEIPTLNGPPISYVKAPLLVTDITVVDEKGERYTLDGVLGMNYLVASAEITGGLLPDIGNIVDGPFRWIVIDLERGVLGVEPR